ncbi:MAG: DUF4350 domain-containing protein [Candidatus Moranbacteria bacterium]|nr:DUF4350 domain-containing protein [Candidatus Moranbacteria bacterium]
MYLYFRLGIIGIAIGSGLSLFVLLAQAGTYQTTVAECQKRTGLSESLCKGIIKNNLTVESCKKQTGLSDEECTQRIEEIRNDPEFSGATSGEVSPVATEEDAASPIARPTSSSEVVIMELRVKKERQLLELHSRTKALASFLKEKGVDVSVVENNFGEFEKKSEALLMAYDMFRTTYRDTMNDSDSTKQAIREKAREGVNYSRSSLIEYYRVNIFDPLRTAYQETL